MSGDTPKGKPDRDEDESPVTGNVTGRVKFDDRGNAVWEWAVGTGKFGTDVSTSRLRKLDNPDLSIIEDTPPPDRRVRGNAQGSDRGYSPYDSGLLGSTDPGHKEVSRRKDLKKLGEWLKLKKQAETNKRGGR